MPWTKRASIHCVSRAYKWFRGAFNSFYLKYVARNVEFNLVDAFLPSLPSTEKRKAFK